MNNERLINKLLISDIDKYFHKKNFSFLKNSSILLTGSSGLVGSHITLTLIRISKIKKLNLKLIILYRDKKKIFRKFKEFENTLEINFIKLRKNKPIKINRKIDKIIHCASFASPKLYNNKFSEVIDANINLTTKLCELAKHQKKLEFIFLSSSEIYGDLKKEKIEEKQYGYINPLLTRSSYGLSKKLAENLLINFKKKYNLNIKIIRLFHTVGWNGNLNDGRLFFYLLNNFQNKKKTIKILSDAKNKRAYCDILDVIDAIFLISKKGKSGEAYNVGNPDNTFSIRSLVQTFKKKTLINKKIIHNSHKDKSYSYTNNKSYYPDITKVKKLGWKPRFSLEDSLDRILNYYSKYS